MSTLRRPPSVCPFSGKVKMRSMSEEKFSSLAPSLPSASTTSCWGSPEWPIGVPRSTHCHSWSRVRLASMSESARSEVSRTVSSKSASPPMSRQAIRTISRRRSRRRSGISASIDSAARASESARSRSDCRSCAPAADAGYGASRSPLATRSASIAGSRSQLEKTKSEQASTRAASPGRASSPSHPAARVASRSLPSAARDAGNGASPRQSEQLLSSFIGDLSVRRKDYPVLLDRSHGNLGRIRVRNAPHPPGAARMFSGSQVASSGAAIRMKTMTTMIRNIGTAVFAT